MLIVKNLKKTYKTKGGVVVHALDDVTITFPENGMVFLLGKSGSGKSTLLNMIGGLDRVDSGEIIVKGKNSKTFSGADYDSYRNTYIGFIFQEYNILNEFNIEQNISLALQLQGKPNDKKAVEAILEQVDLAGLGKRKPNTLSGGQKQRVAIARALIKNPEIIMADEPTGALDSNTGKQVFETLKKLSKDKLVIVVSHDRDFAEFYGDRIIELSDGKIISDTTKTYVEPTAVNENVHIVNDHTVAIKDTSKLTNEDMRVIMSALKNNEGEAVISSGDHDLALVKQAIHLNNDNTSEVFNETSEVQVKEYDPKQTKFIRSKLPFSRAFKMGSSSLKLKPIRLIFTSLLTSIALAMFGLSSTLMLFKESYSISQALQKSDYDSEVIYKYYTFTNKNYNLDVITGEKTGEHSYTNESLTFFDNNDIHELNNNSVGHKYAGLINFHNYLKQSNSYLSLKDGSKTTDYYYYTNILGFSDAGMSYMNEAGLPLIAGSYPTNSNEICISVYQYGVLQLTTEDVEKTEDIINKEYDLRIQGNRGSTTIKAKIVGVYDAGSIPSKFEKLKNSNEINQIDLHKLKDDFEEYLSNSYQSVVFVSDNFFESYSDRLFDPTYSYYGNTSFYLGLEGVAFSNSRMSDDYRVDSSHYASVQTDKIYDYINKPNVYDLDGNPTTYVAPKDNEAYIGYYNYQNAKNEQIRVYYEQLEEMASELIEYDAEFFNNYSTKRDDLRQLSYRLRDSIYLIKEDYPEGYSYEEDKALADSILNTYYVRIKSRDYVRDMAYKLIEGFRRENGDYANVDDFPGYGTFRDNVDAITHTVPYDWSNYESIKSYVEADSNNWLKHYLLYEYAQRAYRVSDDNPDKQQVNTICHIYDSRNPVSESDWQFVKEFIDKYVDLYRYDTFELDLSIVKVMPELIAPTYFYKNYNNKSGQLKVIGYLEENRGELLMNHEFTASLGSMRTTNIYINEVTSDYVKSNFPKYTLAITHTDFNQNQINHMLANYGSYGYQMTDMVYTNLLMILNLIQMLKQIFLISGIVFGVFAALMLFNFITTSIAAKTKEIGILRAVGARGNDLFKIFFSESGLIAFICSLIAIITSYIVCWRLNIMMSEQVGLSMLDFGIINIGLILAGAVLIAIIGTLVPVIIAAKKPPVESIRTL